MGAAVQVTAALDAVSQVNVIKGVVPISVPRLGSI